MLLTLFCLWRTEGVGTFINFRIFPDHPRIAFLCFWLNKTLMFAYPPLPTHTHTHTPLRLFCPHPFYYAPKSKGSSIWFINDVRIISVIFYTPFLSNHAYSTENYPLRIFQQLRNATYPCLGDTLVPVWIKSSRVPACPLGYPSVGGVR